MRDDADALSLVLLLSTSVLCARNEPLAWLWLSFEGTGKDREVDVVVVRRRGR